MRVPVSHVDGRRPHCGPRAGVRVIAPVLAQDVTMPLETVEAARDGRCPAAAGADPAVKTAAATVAPRRYADPAARQEPSSARAGRTAGAAADPRDAGA
jgi:hypothetical protein